jgi:hypothetical protein
MGANGIDERYGVKPIGDPKSLYVSVVNNARPSALEHECEDAQVGIGCN